MMDPISDLLARLHNAYLANKTVMVAPFSKMSQSIAEILVNEGYAEKVEIVGEIPKKAVQIELRYVHTQPAISGIKRLSRPGRRLYSVARDIPKTLGGYGITILSTSKGIMTGSQAKQSNLGGELICQVW